jgi:hypothetical protein
VREIAIVSLNTQVGLQTEAHFNAFGLEQSEHFSTSPPAFGRRLRDDNARRALIRVHQIM